MAKPIITPDLPDADAKAPRKTIEAVVVPGDIVIRYAEASDAIDRAEEVIKKLKPELVEAGLQAVFEHNCAEGNLKKRVSSVNLLSEDLNALDQQDVVQFTWTRKNLKNDAKLAVAELHQINTVNGRKIASVGTYVKYEVVADFDTSVFMVNGKFDQDRYDAFMRALDMVSTKFGVNNPLSCGKMLRPVDDFHDRRFTDFDVETNICLQGVLPTQVSLKPIRPEKSESE